jgi:hypothetical protein
MRWWDPRQYVDDLLSGNVSPGRFVYYVALAALNACIRFAKRDPDYPYVAGLATSDTPGSPLNLQPGELARIRTRAEIMHTIDKGRRNRGLWFDVEMEPYCGKSYRVLDRVTRIIDEKTGKMLKISKDCVILDGAVCSGCRSRRRLFCPRAIYAYWREAWLERAE